jgi:hypothetical protein
VGGPRAVQVIDLDLPSDCGAGLGRCFRSRSRGCFAVIMAVHSDLTLKESTMEKGEKLVVIGRGGVGGPAAMLAKKLMPEVDVTIVGEEDRFIVR